MNRFRAKLVLAGLILTAAVSYLAYAGIKSGRSYYMNIDSFLTDAQYHAQRVRLHGKVAAEGFSVERLTARFTLMGDKGRLPVVYQGAVPDLFKVGAEVVVEGRLDSDGAFRADKLLAKCASKYDPQCDVEGQETPE